MIHRRGVTDVPGLYFLGLSWQHTRGSALLGFVRDDAAYLASRISHHSVGCPPHTPASEPECGHAVGHQALRVLGRKVAKAERR